MTKQGSTKKRIVELLSKGRMTPGEISSRLDLSPSTVSQHLKELTDSGSIKEIENPHFRKSKYYEINKDFNTGISNKTSGFMVSRNMDQKKAIIYTVSALVVIALAYVVLSATSAAASIYSNIPVSITDPPTVPNGTTALYINYSSVSLHLANQDNASGWVQSNSSGNLNLLSLVNLSQIVAGVKLQDNSTINMARFSVRSAQITINGTTYNVSVPNGQITAHMVGQGKVNSTAGVIIDLSPTVAAAYVDNSTVFILIPAARAFVVGNNKAHLNASANATFKLGERRNLTNAEISEMRSSANISLSNQSLIQEPNGNVSFSVSIKNNGNASAEINHVLILGREEFSIVINSNCTAVLNESAKDGCRFIEDQGMNSAHSVPEGRPPELGSETLWHFEPYDAGSLSVNVSISGASHSSGTNVSSHAESNSFLNSGEAGAVTIENVSTIINGSEVHISGSANANAESNPFAGMWHYDNLKVIVANSSRLKAGFDNGSIAINADRVFNIINPVAIHGMAAFSLNEHFNDRSINFIVNPNASLSLRYVFKGNEIEEPSNIGFTLAAGKSVTLMYTGSISPSENIRMSLVNGSSYRVFVIGSGVHMVSNVIAK
jgi:DNA-binding transcriptional ArsR family regulator